MPFTVPTYDELLNAILTDYINQFPGADSSKGSLIYVKSAAIASAFWGLYQHQRWIADQIFPDTAATENLEHHAWIRGITRKSGESDSALVARLLDYIRRPPAGGNKYDYVKWAMAITNVKAAYCIPSGQGVGSVDVVIVADAVATGSEIPSSHAMAGTATTITAGKLMDAAANFTAVANPVRKGDIVRNTTKTTSATVTAVDSATQLTLSSDIFATVGNAYAIDALTVQVHNYIDDLRPVTAKYTRALAPAILTQAVTLSGTGSAWNPTQAAADITAYLYGLIPGQTLYKSQLINIAVINGATDVTVTLPAANVVPTSTQIIRPGVISAT
ncbi:baseplate J/gp47 family protein [Geobacter argillaceus]|uniref:Putative phage protein gp47/JayE n=1 Tax=Geobacter argillaceus TaxID=345631 RepID=A0A562V014_9BACT|nr:baseplate J/gp47 family protein [Geobacter argillaceus]TWJ11168.1 putative phage protein gp47/JayE [Geobacter argillaceus]